MTSNTACLHPLHSPKLLLICFVVTLVAILILMVVFTLQGLSQE